MLCQAHKSAFSPHRPNESRRPATSGFCPDGEILCLQVGQHLPFEEVAGTRPSVPRAASRGIPYQRSAVAIASNEPFSGWTKTFTDPRLCAAIVDRLTFAGQIIETGTTSYRLAHARARRAAG